MTFTATNTLDYSIEASCLEGLPPGSIVLDVGANVGDFSAIAVKRGMEVHAFEPQEVCRSHLMKLGLASVQRVAVGAKPGTAILYKANDVPDLISSLRLRGPVPAIPEIKHGCFTESVDVITLDRYCDKHGVKDVGLMKIDVEGHEPDVLRGAQRIMSQRLVHRVVFEWIDGWNFVDEYQPNLYEMQSWLLGWGYDFQIWDDGWHHYDNIPNEPSMMIRADR